MKQKISLVILLFVIFFIGFLSGSLWQTLLQNQQRISVEQPVKLKPETVVELNQNDSLEAQLEEEEKISQALTNPDFKRVHDFLMREKPIQMNIESTK